MVINEIIISNWTKNYVKRIFVWWIDIEKVESLYELKIDVIIWNANQITLIKQAYNKNFWISQMKLDLPKISQDRLPTQQIDAFIMIVCLLA
jgi:hypothetical protein